MLTKTVPTNPAEALNGQRRPSLTWFLTGISDYSLTHSVFSPHVNNLQVFGLLPLRAFLLAADHNRQNLLYDAVHPDKQLILSIRLEDFTQVL